MQKYEEGHSRFFYIRKNFLWQLMQSCITMVFPLIIRTLFVYKIGDEILGLNSLCISIVAALNVINFGMDSVLVGRMYRPVETKDVSEVCRQLNLYRAIYRIIGLIVLGVGIVLVPFLKDFIKGDIPNINVYFVYFIYLISTVLSYWLFGYYLIIFKATQQIYFLNRNITLGFLLQYILQILAIVMHSYIMYVCFVPISVVFYNISTYWKVRKEYPQYVCGGATDRAERMALKKDIASCAIYKVRDASRDTLDSVVISAILGLVILSNYQNYITVLLVPLTLKTVITGVITPSLGNYNVTATKKEQYDLIKILWLLDLLVSGFFSVCYFQMITDFIDIWLGKDHVLQLSIALMLSIYLFTLGICDFFKMIRQTNQLWNMGKSVAVVETIVNFLLNILLANRMGVFGIVLATVITIIFIYTPFEIWYIIKIYFGQDMIRFWMMLIKILIWVMITNGVVCYIASLVPHCKYISILFKAFISVLVAFVSFITLFHMDDEWKQLKKMVLKKLIRK